jgi:phosphatidylserine decarboxylase
LNIGQNSVIAKQGFPFIIPLALVVVLCALLGSPWVASFFFLLTVFVIWFFRNPERKTPQEENLVISPADGKVIKIEEVTWNEFLSGPSKKISIFMNVFNVHVNRMPYSGKVSNISYRKGKFFSANLDKASVLNEKNSVLIRTEDGRQILTEQIAGLIARRIVCWVHVDEHVNKGDRFGLIRFGSRVDVSVPADTVISVKIGDKVNAGETPLGWLQ